MSVERYLSQIPLIGLDGQRRLRSSRVAIVGVGGLGSNVSLQLVAMGLGRLLLVDHDIITLSNLNRQILYTINDLGKPKVFVAKKRLESLNPEVSIEALQEKIGEDNVDEILSGYDLIVDCLDNVESRKVLDRHAWLKDKILVHGGINGFYGQVTAIKRGKTTCLSCLLSGQAKMKNTSSIISTVSIVSALQTLEVLKIITGIGEPLYNKIAFIDVTEPSISIIKISPYDCGACPE